MLPDALADLVDRSGGGFPGDICTLVEHKRNLYDHPELGHLVVLHYRLELLGPDGLDVADRAGRPLRPLLGSRPRTSCEDWPDSSMNPATDIFASLGR